MKKTVLLGITGGIATYKSLDLIGLLKKEGIDVYVMMTKSASKMIEPARFEKASGHTVYTELFEKGFDYKIILNSRTVDHIALVDKADVIAIVPATANVVGKLAHGLADDFVTTSVLAATCPVIICPAMNVNMWNNSLVQQNIALLKKNKYMIIEPTSGMLACGYEGMGKLMDIEVIKNEIVKKLDIAQSLSHSKIIVTAGATHEMIDDVRYISNRSSGKMGVAIVEACYQLGAEVLLIRAKNSVKPKYQIPEKIFETSQELFDLLKLHSKHFDICYHVAAVGDFEITGRKTGKIKSDKSVTLQLKPAIKIINFIKKWNPHIQLIAFKAESNLSEKELIRVATKRLHETKADAIIANDVGKKNSGFESDMNEVIIIRPDGTIKKIPRNTKQNVAKKIVELISNREIGVQ